MNTNTSIYSEIDIEIWNKLLNKEFKTNYEIVYFLAEDFLNMTYYPSINILGQYNKDSLNEFQIKLLGEYSHPSGNPLLPNIKVWSWNPLFNIDHAMYVAQEHIGNGKSDGSFLNICSGNNFGVGLPENTTKEWAVEITPTHFPSDDSILCLSDNLAEAICRASVIHRINIKNS